MGARDALARLRRKQAYEPAAREMLLSRRHARQIADNLDGVENNAMPEVR